MAVRSAVVVAAAVAAVAGWPAQPAAGHGSAAGPITIATVRGRVYAVAQDDGRVAWRLCSEIGVTSRAGSEPRRIPLRLTSSVPCGAVGEAAVSVLRRDALLLVGDRVIWSEFVRGNKEYVELHGSVGAGRRFSVLPEISLGPFFGKVLGGPAADGTVAVYGIADLNADADCLRERADPRPCPMRLVGGGVWRIEGGERRRVPGAPPAVLVALGGQRLALVGESAEATVRRPRLPGRILQVRDVRTGMLRVRAALAGDPLELAASDSVVALLETTEAGRQFELFDTRSGVTLGTVAVGPTAAQVSASGRTVIYRDGRSIMALTAGDRRARVLVAAVTAPGAISVEGRRVVWSETTRSGGRVTSRIRAVSV